MSISERIRRTGPANQLIHLSQRIVIPGLSGLSVYEVGRFFVLGIMNGSMSTRAASIAYRFFLSLFPAVLFVISLIPYVPVSGFQEGLIQLVTDPFPDELAVFIEGTIRDVVLRQRTGLLSATFVFSLYMATRGVLGIIRSFDASYHDFDTHSRPLQWAISIGLVVLFGSFLVLASVVQIAGGAVIRWLLELGVLPGGLFSVALYLARVVLVALLLFLAISSLYYWAPAKSARARFGAAGSILATIGVLAVNAGFNFYLSNLSRWNAVFGSLGTIIVLLIWLYAASMVLLIGFELNVSICEARSYHSSDGTAD